MTSVPDFTGLTSTSDSVVVSLHIKDKWQAWEQPFTLEMMIIICQRYPSFPRPHRGMYFPTRPFFIIFYLFSCFFFIFFLGSLRFFFYIAVFKLTITYRVVSVEPQVPFYGLGLTSTTPQGHARGARSDYRQYRTL